MQRLIAYVRVSTEEQAESGFGLDAQEAAIARKLPRDARLVKTFRDEGYSGKTIDRPGLQAALEFVARRRADGIIVAKLSRLTRSTSDFPLLVEWASRSDIALLLGEPDVDTSTAGGLMVANVLCAMAQWERDENAERTRAALAAKRAKGQSISRPAVADRPELAERIRHMRDVEGLTLQAIADQLTAEEIPTARGAKKWGVSSVQTAAGYRRPKPRRPAPNLPEAARR